jgi:hypothetical protein
MNIQSYLDKHIRADVTALIEELGEEFSSNGLPTCDSENKISALSAPFLDYEAAARAAGWYQDEGDRFWKADVQGTEIEALTVYNSWQELCERCHITPHAIPIIGHYIVTVELADKLEARGERAERDFGGVIVWARKFAANHDEAAMIHGWRYDSACGWYHPHDSTDAPETYDTAKDICEDLGLAVAGLPLDRDPVLLAIIEAETWTGSPCPRDPDNFWIDDKTRERVNAKTGERTRAA